MPCCDDYVLGESLVILMPELHSAGMHIVAVRGAAGGTQAIRATRLSASLGCVRERGIN